MEEICLTEKTLVVSRAPAISLAELGGDKWRLDMSYDLPGSDHSEVTGLRESHSSNR